MHKILVKRFRSVPKGFISKQLKQISRILNFSNLSETICNNNIYHLNSFASQSSSSSQNSNDKRESNNLILSDDEMKRIENQINMHNLDNDKLISVKLCPFCSEPDRYESSNSFTLQLKKEGLQYNCSKCRIKGSWCDLKNLFTRYILIAQLFKYNEYIHQEPKNFYSKFLFHDQVINHKNLTQEVKYLTETQNERVSNNSTENNHPNQNRFLLNYINRSESHIEEQFVDSKRQKMQEEGRVIIDEINQISDQNTKLRSFQKYQISQELEQEIKESEQSIKPIYYSFKESKQTLINSNLLFLIDEQEDFQKESIREKKQIKIQAKYQKSQQIRTIKPILRSLIQENANRQQNPNLKLQKDAKLCFSLNYLPMGFFSKISSNKPNKQLEQNDNILSEPIGFDMYQQVKLIPQTKTFFKTKIPIPENQIYKYLSKKQVPKQDQGKSPKSEDTK